MSQVLPYEQLIAAKLEQLPPLPALADDIWLRIEKELDEDPPTGEDGEDNDPSGPVPAGGSGQGWSGWSFLIFLGAASLLLFRETGNIRLNDFRLNEPTQTYRMIGPSVAPKPVLQQPDHKDSAISLPPVEPAERLPANSKVITGVDSLDVKPAVGNQSGIKVPDEPVTRQDSNNLLVPLSVSGAREKKPDSVSGGRKKPSGIPISQDEYRVVPKKDSGGP
ncbi:hypothetical protein [Flavihumibacter solisilvae]|uniref:Uncharacterized protein n=1 Tax=Flavihumibacter solisilvae TaxID=1349421 RepID=A0A0C1IS54_9BACT|nr:hypothetical protein [Flavihumibacter solisilvae]KIC93279.1 hypothetical protein OI18_18695 [Flavihumibacter solisilvae]